MEYISRRLERKFIEMSNFFKAVLVTGARQVGKTTMLHRLAEKQERTYITLDNIMARNLAKTDPVLFFQTYTPPIIIDEVQYAPELFGQIKVLCDQNDKPGQFWLTGSQQYRMLKNIRETLAGRVGIMELFSLSSSEKDGIVFSDEIDYSLQALQARQKFAPVNNLTKVFDHIWRGGMPQVLRATAEQRQEYFSSYVSTYLMRDAAELGGITDTLRFGRFLTACAALISQQVNYRNLSEASDVSQPTAKEWLRLLEGMGVVYLLRPFYNNALKRLSKTPKLYFYDTGLAAYLSMWPSKDTLMNGAASGHFFENHVISEFVKHYAYSSYDANLYYYRDSNMKEIDLLIESGNSIHPMEIKKAANPNSREVKKFSVLDNAGITRSNGGIVCMCEEVSPIDANNCYIPCNLI